MQLIIFIEYISSIDNKEDSEIVFKVCIIVKNNSILIYSVPFLQVVMFNIPVFKICCPNNVTSDIQFYFPWQLW